MSIQELGLSGHHHVYHSLAESITASVYGLRKENIREAYSDFKSLEHRMEPVAKVRSVNFVNDSKATNVNSTWFALDSMTNPVVWIAGGIDKGNDYSEILPLVRSKVHAIICLGVDNDKLVHAFKKLVTIMVNVTNMNDAVRMAYNLANPGDNVLLSPACASFDLFENYEERGKKFKDAVIQL